MAEMAEIAMLNIYLPYLLFQRDPKKQLIKEMMTDPEYCESRRNGRNG